MNTDYYRLIASYPLLDDAEQQVLFAQAKQGDTAAREKIINGNLRMALKISHSYYNSGSEMDDIFQAACEGLIIAVDKYDPGRGMKLSTYAYQWMRERIERQITTRLEVPDYMRWRLNRIAQARKQLLLQGVEPTDAAIMAETGLAAGEYRTAQAAINKATPASLDETTSNAEGDATQLLDTLQDDSPGLDLIAERADTISIVQDAIQQLLPRERDILQMRYSGQTLQEVGDKYGITRERVRQLQTRAEHKLKRMQQIKQLT